MNVTVTTCAGTYEEITPAGRIVTKVLPCDRCDKAAAFEVESEGRYAYFCPEHLPRFLRTAMNAAQPLRKVPAPAANAPRATK